LLYYYILLLLLLFPPKSITTAQLSKERLKNNQIHKRKTNLKKCVLLLPPLIRRGEKTKTEKNEITNPRNTNYRKEKEIQRDERRQKTKVTFITDYYC